MLPMKAAFVIVAVLLAAGLSIAAWGQWRWRGLTLELVQRMESARQPPRPARVDLARELDGLPPVVQRFFRAALRDGAPMVAALDIGHTGTFDMGEDGEQWRPFTSSQRVVARRPGFVWDGRVNLFPGAAVHVHDAYVAGDGILHPAILGVFDLADLRGGGDVAQGELMRFLAEAAWYPTALLPSQGVRWEGIDDRSARATLTDGATTVSLSFVFGADALVASVRADARGRTVAGRVLPTPWEGRWSDHAERDGLRVPLRGEVAWLLPEGRKPYWRGEVTSLRYEFAP